MTDASALDRAREALAGARRVAVLTGSGASAESGVPTFRDATGLWEQVRLEDVATPEAFAADPAGVWRWYDARRRDVANAEPNPAHRALAQLEDRVATLTLITQNVDGLHRAAGSSRVVELHGSLWDPRCTGCGATRPDRRVPLPELPPRCPDCGEWQRPGVVWFGEALPAGALEEAAQAAREAEVFLSVGTAAEVEPAASLPRLARQAGTFVVEINPQPSAVAGEVDLALRGPAGELLPRLVPGPGGGSTR